MTLQFNVHSINKTPDDFVPSLRFNVNSISGGGSGGGEQTLKFEGYPLVATGVDKDGYLQDYQIYGNTTQDTTPAVDSPVDPVAVGMPTLPMEYQEVEYIEVTESGAYIDTGLLAVTNTKVELKYYTVANSGNYIIFGARTSSSSTGDNFNLFQTGATFRCDIGGISTSSTIPVAVSTIYEIEVSIPNKTLIANGITGSASSTTEFTTGTYSIYLFALNQANVVNFPMSVGTRFYYYRQYEGDTLVGNFIPCYRKVDSVAGMYDTVSGTFFTNANTTGSFSVGSDVNPTVNVNCYKNLFDPTSTDITDGNRTNAQGIPMPTPDTEAGLRFISQAIPVTAGETLIINWQVPSTTGYLNRLGFYNSSEISTSSFISDITESTDYKLVVPDGATYMRFTGLIANKDSYKVYSLQETVPLTISRPLYSVESTLPTDNSTAHTYVDYIDFKNSRVVRNTGFFHITRGTAQAEYSRFLTGFSELAGFSSDRRRCYSNRGTYTSDSVGLIFMYGGSSSSIYYYPETTINTAALYAEWLAENYLYVIAPIASPTYEDVDLSYLPVYEGDTYYTVDGLEPSNMIGIIGQDI